MSSELRFGEFSPASRSSPTTSASPASTAEGGAGSAEPSIIKAEDTATKVAELVSPKPGSSDVSPFMDLSEIFTRTNLSKDKEITRFRFVDLDIKTSIDIDLNKILEIFQKTFQEYKKDYKDNQNVRFKFRFYPSGQIEVRREIVKEVDNEYEFASDDMVDLANRLIAKGVDVSISNITDGYLDRYLQRHGILWFNNKKFYVEKLRELYANWITKELNPKYNKKFQLACHQISRMRFLNPSEQQKQIESARTTILKMFENEIQKHLADFERFNLENLRDIGKEFHLLYAPSNTKEEMVDELMRRFNFKMKDKIYEIAEKNRFIIAEDSLEFEKTHRDVDQTNYVIQNPLDLYHLLRNTLFPEIKNFKSQEEKYRFFADYNNLPKAYGNNQIFIQIFETCRNIEAAKADLKRFNQRSRKSADEEKRILEKLNNNLSRLDILLSK
jgi:hypothetical protein